MHFRLLQYKENIYASFWVLPLLMSLAMLALCTGLLVLEEAYGINSFAKTLAPFVNVDGAKVTLTIIASSVISITSVTFSITVLTLSLSSNQLGPRILPNFMRRKPTQIVLGFFVGTFIYAMNIIHYLTEHTHEHAPPYLAILLGDVFGMACFFMLIYFIHYVCHGIQLDNVLEGLSRDTLSCFKRQCRNTGNPERSCHEPAAEPKMESYAKLSTKQAHVIHWRRAGYVQTIDYNELYRLAIRSNCCIELHTSIGQFIFEGLELAVVYSDGAPEEKLVRQIREVIQVGGRRSTTQDLLFAFEELSEITLRLIANGASNPYTASHCIDRIFQGFAALSSGHLHPDVVTDTVGEIRLIKKTPSYSDIVRTGLSRIRQAAAEDLIASTCILENIVKVLALSDKPVLNTLLKQEASQLVRAVKKIHDDPADLQTIERLANEIASD